MSRTITFFFLGMGGLRGMPGAAEMPGKPEVEALVRHLSDERFAFRQKAQEELMVMGEPVEQLLQAFRNDPDPEIRLRVERVLDHVASLRRELKWIDPKLEGKGEYVSKVMEKGVELTFRNLSRKPVRVFWIDTRGERKPWRGVMKPGATAICERSYVTHVWLITDVDEKPLGIYNIDIDDPVIAIRDEIWEK